MIRRQLQKGRAALMVTHAAGTINLVAMSEH